MKQSRTRSSVSASVPASIPASIPAKVPANVRVGGRAEGDGEVIAVIGGAEALYRLGLSYSIGQGVPRDLVSAHKWLNLAASRGSLAARDIRAEVARDMTAGEIAEAQRQAREWIHAH